MTSKNNFNVIMNDLGLNANRNRIAIILIQNPDVWMDVEEIHYKYVNKTGFHTSKSNTRSLLNNCSGRVLKQKKIGRKNFYMYKSRKETVKDSRY